MRMPAALALCLTLAAGAATLTSASEVGDSRAFSTVQIHLDVGERPLAAYQLTLQATREDTRLVGVEGGGAGFAEPPRYDPRALRGGHIKLAALRLEEPLPIGRVHVATLHVEHAADHLPQLDVLELVAVDRDGRATPAESSQEIGD